MTFAAAGLYNSSKFSDGHHMFKVADTLFVSGGIGFLLMFFMLLDTFEKFVEWYKQKFVKAFIVFMVTVQTFLVSGTWCGLAALDSYIGFNGSKTAWDATGSAIERSMAAAFATHTAAITCSFATFACVMTVV